MHATMRQASELVARPRADSGLSQRALASRAGCSRSTILRIEAGEMDPTVTMLARIAAAAGRRLAIDTTRLSDGPRLAELAESADDIDAIDWTYLRGIIDWLSPTSRSGGRSNRRSARRSGDERIDNLLAATAEKIADDLGCPRPRWTATVPALSEPWRPPGTPRMQAVEAASAPPQFACRNLLVGAQNLWRTE